MPNGWDSTGEEIWNGIKQGMKNAILSIGTWLQTNIVEPFVTAFKNVFGIHSPSTVMEDPGKSIGEGILEGLLQPFKNIAAWIDEHIVQPIKNALKNFSIKDLIFGGDDSGSSSSGNDGWLSGIFGGSIDLEANVTSVKDSVPSDKRTLGDMVADLKDKIDDIPIVKKTIDGIKGIFGSTDKGDGLSTADKTIDSKANFTSLAKKFPTSYSATSSGQTPMFAARANFTSMVKHFASGATAANGATPLMNARANFTSMVKHFASGATKANGTTPQINSQANFTSRRIVDLNRVFGSTADFTKRIIDISTTIAALAYFDDYSNGLTGWKKPQIGVDAYVDHFDSRGYPVSYGYGATGGIWGARGKIADIPQYASGGRPHGSMFIAGEAGAELVGHIGGRTEVLNRSQLAATMYSAVRSAMSGIAFNVSSPSMGTGTTDDGANEDMLYRAFLRALNDSDNTVEVDLDGVQIYKNVVKRNRMEKARTGMNPMLSY